MLTVLKLVLCLNGAYGLKVGDVTYQCAIGKSGIIENKVEGDEGTPVGRFHLKNLYYRKDKFVEEPQTGLPKIEITQDLGWCDEPTHPEYNRPVTSSFDFSHEKMWREDDLYDLVIEIDHNSDPVVPDKGSAVFIHVAREGYTPTAGCIALKKEDLLEILKMVSRRVILEVKNPGIFD
ncbi:MAG: L,D-transpeptidase family protein [Alphaproteobacteria bacterium]|nr:L,D-transpeptidase family protein [Alphaproteobacteria bacterium]